jgi:hypothetical protein
MKSNISSELIGVLNRMFAESWGPRLEYILRYTLLALLDRPSTTMLDITRMLTDKKFRKETLSYSKDTVVLQFWNVEFASWTEKFQSEAIAPILNKVGAFTANPIIRNIIGQPKSTFNVRQIMDEGKILIVNLSKGLLGEDNSSILGALLVTKIQLAAMSRSDIPNIADRRPFYLYVDEFQNFATDSFATILSEARKYGLNLTVANQYTSQMSDTVRDAVFGNVGTMISFRISADDAPVLVKQFEPEFEANDLLQMNNRNFVMNMVINGEKVPAFSARTLQLPPPQADNTAAIVEYTRTHYSRTREDVEASINALILPPEQLQRKGPGNPGFKMSQPESAAQAKQWPIDASAKPAGESSPQTTPVLQPAKTSEPNRPKVIIETPAGEAAIAGNTALPPQNPALQTQPGEGEAAPAKRKRSRSRKRKSGSGENSADGSAPAPHTENSSTSSESAPTHHKSEQQPSTHHHVATTKPAHDPTKLSVRSHAARPASAAPEARQHTDQRQAPQVQTAAPRPEPKPRDASLLKIR